MSYLIDTNVLVRLAQPKNPDQREARRALRVLRRRPDFLGIIPQNLIEFWAVATRPASSNGLDLTPNETARQMGKLKALFTLLPDSSDIFSEWEGLVLQHQVLGNRLMTRVSSPRCTYTSSHICSPSTLPTSSGMTGS